MTVLARVNHRPRLPLADRRAQHCRGAVVSGSFQGFDSGYLIDALAALGLGFVGVTQIPADTTGARIAELDRAVARRCCSTCGAWWASLSDLDRLSYRVYDMGVGQVKLFIDARSRGGRRPNRRLLAASIDHLGLNADGLPIPLRLVERGVKAKATGFGRIGRDPVDAITRTPWRSTRPR